MAQLYTPLHSVSCIPLPPFLQRHFLALEHFLPPSLTSSWWCLHLGFTPFRTGGGCFSGPALSSLAPPLSLLAWLAAGNSLPLSGHMVLTSGFHQPDWLTLYLGWEWEWGVETLGPQMSELPIKTSFLGGEALAVEGRMWGKYVLVEPAFWSFIDTSHLVNPSFLFREQD